MTCGVSSFLWSQEDDGSALEVRPGRQSLREGGTHTCCCLDGGRRFRLSSPSRLSPSPHGWSASVAHDRSRARTVRQRAAGSRGTGIKSFSNVTFLSDFDMDIWRVVRLLFAHERLSLRSIWGMLACREILSGLETGEHHRRGVIRRTDSSPPGPTFRNEEVSTV